MKVRSFMMPLLFSALMITCCNKEERVSPKTFSLLQNKWMLISRTAMSVNPPILNGRPYHVYDRYEGTISDSYHFSSDGRVFISEYNMSSVLKYSVLNDTTLKYAPYEAYTWSEKDNPITIKKLTDSLLVLSYPIGGYATSRAETANWTGVSIDSLKRY